MHRAVIIIFLAFQIALPLQYYANNVYQASHKPLDLENKLSILDERYCWRMFSEKRYVRCQVSLSNGSYEFGPEKDLSAAWNNALSRGRYDVIKKYVDLICEEVNLEKSSSYQKPTRSPWALEVMCTDQKKGVIDYQLDQVCLHRDQLSAGKPWLLLAACVLAGLLLSWLLFREASPVSRWLGLSPPPSAALASISSVPDAAVLTASSPSQAQPQPNPAFDLAITAFFLLYAWDLLTDQFPRAALYGIGRLAVSHMEGLLPGKAVEDSAAYLGLRLSDLVALSYLTQAFLAFMAAMGQRRPALPLLALLSAATYVASQLDSYQHHYLVLVLCWLLWLAPPLLAPPLLFLQVSLTYVWAFVTKLHPDYLSGAVMAQLTGPVQVIRSLPFVSHLPLPTVLQLLSLGSVSMEIFLALALLNKRTFRLACALGCGFHLTIELLDFKIGLFSYYLMALFLSGLPANFATAVLALPSQLKSSLAFVPTTLPLDLLSSVLASLLPLLLEFDISTHLVALLLGYVPLGFVLARAQPQPGRLTASTFLRSHALAAVLVVLLCVLFQNPYRLLVGRGTRLLSLGDQDPALADLLRAFRLQPSPELRQTLTKYLAPDVLAAALPKISR